MTTAVAGQLVFAFAVASFYASAAVRGNLAAWNRFMPHGYVAGETLGNNFAERELNALGYQLLRGNQIDDAIRVFELNVEAYPRSSNSYDSLGEANGQR
jgi:hypothetical protein